MVDKDSLMKSDTKENEQNIIFEQSSNDNRL